MKIYGLCKRNNMKFIAFHNEKRVIIKFKQDYELSNKEDLVLVALKQKEIEKFSDYSDLYLVRYGENYVQSKFLYIAQLDYGQIEYDYNYAKDVLNCILEFIDDDKKSKRLMQAIRIIEEELESIQSNIPSIESLTELDEEYKIYQGKI